MFFKPFCFTDGILRSALIYIFSPSLGSLFSQRCSLQSDEVTTVNGLKERRRSCFDLLQNQLIVVSCRATCVSETAGMVPSAGGCPPAGVNGSGVVGRNCRERRKNRIKNFPAWLSQTNARSKNGGRSLCDILIGRETVLVRAGAHVSRSPRLASCLVSAPNQRQRSAFDLFTAQNCYSAH